MQSLVYSRDSNGRMKIGNHDLVDLVNRFGSPLYIYNFEHLRQVYQRLRSRLHPAIVLYYAVKANPNPAIIKQYVELGAGFDLSSVEELRLVMDQGGSPTCMSFAGPGKKDKELQEAMSAHVGALSIESLSELKSIERIAEDMGSPIAVTIRINPAQKTSGFSVKMGGIPSPFGIDEELLPDIVDLVRQSKWLTITGLHVFSGTQSLDENAIVENVQNILRLAESLCGTYGVRCTIVNIGGGLGVPYHQDEKELNENQVISGVNHAIESYLKNKPRTQFIFELGRYLVASSGFYVATVVRKKRSRGFTFLVLDGGMNHYLAASGNLGQVFLKNFPVLHGTKKVYEEEGQSYHVVGPLCTPIDRLATDIQLPFTEEGDLVVFPLAGAYAYTASPLRFLSHPAPAEVAVDGNDVYIIRSRIDSWYLGL